MSPVATVRRAIRAPLAACAIAVVLLTVSAGAAFAVEPPTPLGFGTRDFAVGANTPDDQPFWEVYDPNSGAQVHFSFNTTPELGSPTPALAMLGAHPDGRQYVGAAPANFTVSHDPPSISSDVGSVAWVPAQQAFHLVVHNTFMDADLWFTGPTGGAMLPAAWDAEQTYWEQSLGTGKVNGYVRFPGDLLPTTVTNWFGEQESQYGPFQIGTGPDPTAAPTHIGYDYNVAAMPDGTTVVMYGIPELDGVWRGIITETDASGTTRQCEPPTFTQGNYTTLAAALFTGVVSPGTYEWAQTVSARCTAGDGTDLDYSFTYAPETTTLASFADPLDGFNTTDSLGGQVFKSGQLVSGAKVAGQYLRQRAYYGETP
jgi:hypothetical protein